MSGIVKETEQIVVILSGLEQQQVLTVTYCEKKAFDVQSRWPLTAALSNTPILVFDLGL